MKPRLDKPLTIAVTGLNATDNPGPGVPVLRSLTDADPNRRLIGLLYDALEPGVYMEDLTERNYLIPYPSMGLDAIYDRIAQIHADEHIDVLVPTLDTELYLFHKLAGRFRELGIHTFIPTTEQLHIRGKDRLSEFCKRHDVKTPPTVTVSTITDLKSAVAKLDNTVVIKGIFYDAYAADGGEEAVAAFHKVTKKWGLPVIVQQRLQGDEFNVTGLGDGNGNVVGAVAMRKLVITDKGKGWAGVSIRDESLLDLSRRVISALRWRGGLELEFMREKGNGDFSLLEINPRFPAWVYLATAAGQNLPEALVAMALGRPAPAFNGYEVGKVFVRASWDLITDMGRIEQLTTSGKI